MLFRPEEVHGASGVTDVGHPLGERHRDVCVIIEGFGIELLSVFHFDDKHFTAIQAGEVHPHGLAREQPADRQRFKASLSEPFWAPIHGNIFEN